MPLPFIDISGSPYLPFGDIRNVIADCIEFTIDPTTSGARIYPQWIYEIDINSMLGKVTAAMRAKSGTSAGMVHCWTIGIERAMWQTINGVPDILGSQNSQWYWDIDINVWGFFEHDGTDTTQRAMENEARLVSGSLWRNSNIIVAGTNGLSELKALQFSNLAPTPFSDGTQVAVAAGSMKAIVNEALTS